MFVSSQLNSGGKKTHQRPAPLICPLSRSPPCPASSSTRSPSIPSLDSLLVRLPTDGSLSLSLSLSLSARPLICRRRFITLLGPVQTPSHAKSRFVFVVPYWPAFLQWPELFPSNLKFRYPRHQPCHLRPHSHSLPRGGCPDSACQISWAPTCLTHQATIFWDHLTTLMHKKKPTHSHSFKSLLFGRNWTSRAS